MSTRFAGDHLVTNLQSLRCQDVGEFAVLVLDQRNERGAVGVVFQPLNHAWHVELATLEVHHAIGLLVSTAAEPGGDAAMVVASAVAVLSLGQALDGLALPQLGAVDQDGAAKAGRNGIELPECHFSSCLPGALREAGGEIDRLAGRQGHDGLLEVRAHARASLEALGLAFLDQRVHRERP